MSGNRSLEGKIAIVTGGRRGIGKAIALAFAEAGADVAVCSQTGDDRLAAVAEDIKKLGRRSVAVRADVSQKADVDNMVQRVIDEFGRIDILVNGAGMWIPGQTVLECSEDNWDRVMDVDLKGVYLCCQAAGRKMVDQKSGNIVNVASRAGVYPRPSAGAYCTSKAGVVMLTRQLALELAEYNIRVNAIAPGIIPTQGSSKFAQGKPDYREAQLKRIPLGRFGKPDDIVGVAVFLASEASAYITGETIVVDGGLTSTVF